MPVVATDPGGKEFTPAPEGLHSAVCVDVVDLGMQPNKFNPEKPQHKVRLVWQIEETDPENNKRFIVSQMYTLSLHEKASLRKDLEGWRAKKFTADEGKGFDLEKLLGVPCQVQIIHNVSETNGKTYANVQAIVPLGKGMARLAVDGTYTRVCDRPDDAKDGLVSKPKYYEEDVPF
jgi:hypothetical protein